MTELLGESVLRDRNVTTLPAVVRDMWNISVGERIRWELTDTGDICVCRVISKKVNNNCGGGNVGEIEKQVDDIKSAGSKY